MKHGRRLHFAIQNHEHVVLSLTTKAARAQGMPALHYVGFLARPLWANRMPNPSPFVEVHDNYPLPGEQCHTIPIDNIADWHPIPVILTDEDKARMTPTLRATWHGIGPDCGFVRTVDEIIELVCDANRPEDYGMKRHDYKLLCLAYDQPDTQAWLRKVLNYA